MLNCKKTIIIIIAIIILSACARKQNNPSTQANFNEESTNQNNNSVKSLSILARDNYSAVVLEDGTVWVWGDTLLTEGSPSNQNSPKRIQTLSDIRTISGGSSHLLAINNDDILWGLGSNRYGQIGDGTYKDRLNPVELKDLQNIIQLDLKMDTSIGLKKNGTVWAWGDNTYGQLGGDRDNISMPEQVLGLEKIKHVVSGGLYSLALKEDGFVYAWGWFPDINTCVEGYGSEPSKVVGISDVISISGSQSEIIALKKDGTVWHWGDIDAVQQVQDLKDIVTIGQGSYHNLAIDKYGNVWTWGNNEYGQLGNGLAENKYFSPQKVEGLGNIVAVAGGDGHSIALDKEGQLWVWGNNESGQLGNGTEENSYRPIRLLLE